MGAVYKKVYGKIINNHTVVQYIPIRMLYSDIWLDNCHVVENFCFLKRVTKLPVPCGARANHREGHSRTIKVRSAASCGIVGAHVTDIIFAEIIIIKP